MSCKAGRPVRARDIDSYLRTLAAAHDPNERVLYGDPDTTVGGILCAWKATTDAIDKAARLGCNVLLVHETLFDPSGEAQEYACQYVQDCGCGLIELGHAASEDLGIKRLARIVARRFTGLKVRFYALRPAFAWM